MYTFLTIVFWEGNLVFCTILIYFFLELHCVKTNCVYILHGISYSEPKETNGER